MQGYQISEWSSIFTSNYARFNESPKHVSLSLTTALTSLHFDRSVTKAGNSLGCPLYAEDRAKVSFRVISNFSKYSLALEKILRTIVKMAGPR